ncbi:protein of unknown function DUF883, ElaB [Acidovorax sp. JS42]|nr:protein of unknown function DUF883, ElaB [Acidovorax sp. JS42]
MRYPPTWFAMHGVLPLFPAMKGSRMTTVSETISSTQAELEKLVGDLRGLLASKDLDGIPEIKQLRQRLDDGIHSVRDSAVRAAQEAALQAKDAARAADRYAHDEPWRVAGAALAVGALVGFMLARR